MKLMFDSCAMSKVAITIKPPRSSTSCMLYQQYCDVVLTLNPLWKLAVTWSPAVKYFLRGHLVVRLNVSRVSWSLPLCNPRWCMDPPASAFRLRIYFALHNANPGMVNPNNYIAPRNRYIMSFRDFISHRKNVLIRSTGNVPARTKHYKL